MLAIALRQGSASKRPSKRRRTRNAIGRSENAGQRTSTPRTESAAWTPSLSTCPAARGPASNRGASVQNQDLTLDHVAPAGSRGTRRRRPRPLVAASGRTGQLGLHRNMASASGRPRVEAVSTRPARGGTLKLMPEGPKPGELPDRALERRLGGADETVVGKGAARSETGERSPSRRSSRAWARPRARGVRSAPRWPSGHGTIAAACSPEHRPEATGGHVAHEDVQSLRTLFP